MRRSGKWKSVDTEVVVDAPSGEGKRAALRSRDRLRTCGGALDVMRQVSVPGRDAGFFKSRGEVCLLRDEIWIWTAQQLSKFSEDVQGMDAEAVSPRRRKIRACQTVL